MEGVQPERGILHGCQRGFPLRQERARLTVQQRVELAVGGEFLEARIREEPAEGLLQEEFQPRGHRDVRLLGFLRLPQGRRDPGPEFREGLPEGEGHDDAVPVAAGLCHDRDNPRIRHTREPDGARPRDIPLALQAEILREGISGHRRGDKVLVPRHVH